MRTFVSIKFEKCFDRKIKHTKTMRYRLPYYLIIVLVFTSCTSLRYTGVNRIRDYRIESPNVPEAFDGYRIAFASDFHLKSKFKEKQLQGTAKALQALGADILLLGGDYQEGCEYVEPIIATLGAISTPDGIYAVLGNNDYERCTDITRAAMKKHGIILLEDSTATLRQHEDSIVIWGANAYSGLYPTTQKKKESPIGCGDVYSSAFTILLTHTPDYVEDADITGVDLAFAGHTHGGQITLFGLYAPVTASKYGTQFRTGLRHNSQGIPVIISGGLGTSRYPIRFCAPTDVIIVTLKREIEP